MNFAAAGSDTSDKLQLLSGVTGARLTSNGVEISVSDTDKAVLKGLTANSKIDVASENFTGIAKVGSATSANSFTLESNVSYYGGGSGVDRVSLASNDSNNYNIWLDGSQGVAYNSIDVIDDPCR